jgi:hypothetical protein
MELRIPVTITFIQLLGLAVNRALVEVIGRCLDLAVPGEFAVLLLLVVTVPGAAGLRDSHSILNLYIQNLPLKGLTVGYLTSDLRLLPTPLSNSSLQSLMKFVKLSWKYRRLSVFTSILDVCELARDFCRLFYLSSVRCRWCDEFREIVDGVGGGGIRLKRGLSLSSVR